MVFLLWGIKSRYVTKAEEKKEAEKADAEEKADADAEEKADADAEEEIIPEDPEIAYWKGRGLPKLDGLDPDQWVLLICYATYIQSMRGLVAAHISKQVFDVKFMTRLVNYVEGCVIQTFKCVIISICNGSYHRLRRKFADYLLLIQTGISAYANKHDINEQYYVMAEKIRKDIWGNIGAAEDFGRAIEEGLKKADEIKIIANATKNAKGVSIYDEAIDCMRDHALDFIRELRKSIDDIGLKKANGDKNAIFGEPIMSLVSDMHRYVHDARNSAAWDAVDAEKNNITACILHASLSTSYAIYQRINTGALLRYQNQIDNVLRRVKINIDNNANYNSCTSQISRLVATYSMSRNEASTFLRLSQISKYGDEFKFHWGNYVYSSSLNKIESGMLESYLANAERTRIVVASISQIDDFPDAVKNSAIAVSIGEGLSDLHGVITSSASMYRMLKKAKQNANAGYNAIILWADDEVDGYIENDKFVQGFLDNAYQLLEPEGCIILKDTAKSRIVVDSYTPGKNTNWQWPTDANGVGTLKKVPILFVQKKSF